MRLNHPCEEMVRDAAKLPADANIKLFMRHAIRYDNPVNGDYSSLLLTPEGIRMAQDIGRSLDRPVGGLYASTVERCRQTVREIAAGAGTKAPEIVSKEVYSGSAGAYKARDEHGVGWFEYFYGLQRSIDEYTWGATLYGEAKPIVDAIFAEPGEGGKLDIICSHDSHVVVLASALFGLKTGIHGENWCRYTEGLFFTGTRDDFTAYWRGEEKRFRNW
ncbi:MAG: histidine phosphatase family protein [Lachnospiraceae bacterium]|nr:histidine phosphatase family protein [Lachnospiraceae bacterium]